MKNVVERNRIASSMYQSGGGLFSLPGLLPIIVVFAVVVTVAGIAWYSNHPGLITLTPRDSDTPVGGDQIYTIKIDTVSPTVPNLLQQIGYTFFSESPLPAEPSWSVDLVEVGNWEDRVMVKPLEIIIPWGESLGSATADIHCVSLLQISGEGENGTVYSVQEPVHQLKAEVGLFGYESEISTMKCVTAPPDASDSSSITTGDDPSVSSSCTVPPCGADSTVEKWFGGECPEECVPSELPGVVGVVIRARNTVLGGACPGANCSCNTGSHGSHSITFKGCEQRGDRCYVQVHVTMSGGTCGPPNF
jgi:hypothetical protein